MIKNQKMTEEDLKLAKQMVTIHKKIYLKDKGFISASDYIHLTFSSFVNTFENYKIQNRSSDWKLSTRYKGIEIMAIANYEDMIAVEKTRQYLEEIFSKRDLIDRTAIYRRTI